MGTGCLPIVIDLVSISSLLARIPRPPEPRAPRRNLYTSGGAFLTETTCIAPYKGRGPVGAERIRARRHVFAIAVLGATAGYLVWFLLPLGAGHHDLAIFALVTIETVLSIVYRNFLSRPWTSGGIDRAKNG